MYVHPFVLSWERFVLSNPIRLIVLGAGNRGNVYASYALSHPDLCKVVAVAEPRSDALAAFAQKHGLDSNDCFNDWQDIAAKAKFADAVIITTQDRMHTEPALAFAALGYHILLEKPMAPSPQECLDIVSAVKENNIMMAVGHVLRYTPFTRALKAALDDGVVGEIVSIQLLEPLGYWHQAHSFVRGNWANTEQSSFMLLAKSCHDLDWLRYIIGEPCDVISSFGRLSYFHKGNKPEEAGDALRCLDCAYEARCPYSAKKIYLERVRQGKLGTPVSILTLDLSLEGVTEVLRTGPYGRCVYECDNDVVDHQVVNMQFQSGKTASFTMTGFNKERPRSVGIFGTHGEIQGDGQTFEIFDFLTDTTKTVDTSKEIVGPNTVTEGHGGGDYGLIASFIEAIQTGDETKLLSGPDESLESHLMVFAAEQSRLEQRLVKLSEFWEV